MVSIWCRILSIHDCVDWLAWLRRSARPRLVELLAAAQASTALTPTRARGLGGAGGGGRKRVSRVCSF